MTSGFYYRDGVRHRSIVIKHPGRYPPAPGYKKFTLSPLSYQEKVIRRNVKKYGPKKVHEEVAAIHAFTYRDPNPKIRKNAVEDLAYAETFHD